MKRALKLALPVLVLAELFLIWSGVMSFKDALLVVIGVEILLLVVGTGNLFLVLCRYRRGRKRGLDWWAALEDGLTVMLPGSWGGLS